VERKDTIEKKKIKGRKRHIITDTLGHLLEVRVHRADIQDRDGVKEVLKEDYHHRHPRLSLIYADKGYRGRGVKYMNALGLECEIVRHRRDKENYLVKEDEKVVLKGFKVLPKRWIVERTFAWISRCRRLSKDYEFYEKTTEQWFWLRNAQLLWRRSLANSL